MWELLKRDPRPLAFAAVALLASLYATVRTDPPGYLPPADQNAHWIVQVQKTYPPHGKYQKIEATPLAARDSTSVWLAAKPTRLEFYLDTSLALRPLRGNTLAVRGKLRTLDGSYGTWLRAQGIDGRVYSYRAAVLDSAVLPPTWADRAAATRARLAQKIATASPDTAATALMAALSVSAREQMDPEAKARYRRAGAAHLLAISGLHVGIVVALLNLLLGALKLGRRGRIAYGLLVVALLWGYAWLTGMSVPVVRAVVMFSLLELGLMAVRTTSSLNLLSAAALGILVWNPRALFDVGFQLSFVAMLGIVTLYRPLFSLVRIRRRWVEVLWGLVVVSVVAQAATAPLAAYVFGQLPLLGVVLNLIVWVTVPVVIVGSVLFLMGVPVGAPTAFAAAVQNGVVDWFAGIPWGTIEGVELPLWGVWAIYAAMGAGAWWFVRRRRKHEFV